MASNVWHQYRSFTVGPLTVEDLDMDISISKPRDDPLEFDITFWNVDPSQWDRIDQENHLVRVQLGWVDGRQDTVILGEITHMNEQPDRGDVEYRLKGTDESEIATHHRMSRTWNGARPDQIVNDIAREIGLTPVTGNAGGRINGNWAMTADQKVRAWLDELLDYAVEFTGQEWEWYAREGELVFQPRNETGISAPLLAYGNTLLSIGRKSNADDDVELELEFEAMLDPRIRTGAVVFVETDRFEGAFRVSDYEFRSNTDSGDHLVRGTLTPVEADYSRAEDTYELLQQFDESATNYIDTITGGN